MTFKAFDYALYNNNDDRARQATTDWLDDHGYDAEAHPNPYAQDLVATDRRTGKKFLVECEVKNVWRRGDFPYDSVQLPERKKKFFAEKTLFFIWSNTCMRAVIFWSSAIKDLVPVEVPNKHIASGEKFFQIPLELTKQVEL